MVALVVPLKQALIIGPSRTNENALCQIKRELQSQPPNRIQHRHTHRGMRAHKQFTEVVYSETTILSDVWMTANPLNNAENTVTVLFLAGKKTSGLVSEGKGEGQ